MGRDQVNGQPTPPGPPEQGPGFAQSQSTPAANSPAKRSRRRDATFAAVTLVLVLGLLEAVLRLSGFRFVPVPRLVSTTWDSAALDAMNKSMGGEVFQPDDILFWSMKPGARYEGRTVNELGLLNPPVQIPKPRGMYRIVCLGDSCTAFGPVAYPMVLQRRLSFVARPYRWYDVINAGVFSYTSHQGLRLFRHRLAAVQPDLVTVYYGWNDHYFAQGYPDKLLKERQAVAPAPIRLLRRLRLYQLTQRIVYAGMMLGVEPHRVRVAPEDYRANLRRFVELAAERGAPAVLLTAPSNHSVGRVPQFFLDWHMTESDEALIVRHRNYNNIVREVAAEKRAPLVDLDQVFNEHDKDTLFMKDGVHPNARGRHLIADLLTSQLAKMKVISPQDEKEIAEKSVYDSRDPNLLRSRIEFIAPLETTADRPLEIALKATNTGDTTWLARTDDMFGQVRLGVRVFDTSGTLLFERERGVLERDVPPGDQVTMRWTVSPIRTPGEYVLEVGGVAEQVAWFRDLGDAQTTMPLTVKEAGYKAFPVVPWR